MSRTAAGWIVIVAAGLGTYAFRSIFLLSTGAVHRLPPRSQRALQLLPAAVLAALAAPAFLRPAGAYDWWSPQIAAGAVTAIVVWLSGWRLVAVLAGVTVFWLSGG